MIVSVPEVAEAPGPTQAPELDDTTRLLSTGGSHTCLWSGATLRCWGFNEYRQIGDGSTLDRPAPVVVKVPDVAMLSVGGVNTCAAHGRGTVSCWGSNGWGQLGRSGKDSSQPVSIAGIADAIEVAVGTGTVCVVHRAGAVSCWGDGSSGQLGPHHLDRSLTPVSIEGLAEVVELAVDSYLVCARRRLGSVYCWGEPWMGLMPGPGPPPGFVATSTPAELPGVVDATGLALGDHHACVLTGAGAVWCWGGDSFGQLGRRAGDGPEEAKYDFHPAPVEGLPQVVRVVAGADHSCAIDAEGGLWCWGANRYGQLGARTTDDAVGPTLVELPGSVTQVAAGAVHTCALVASGEVLCWGSNVRGQCGLDAEGPVLEPNRVLNVKQ